MSNAYLPVHLDVTQLNKAENVSEDERANRKGNRRQRSNSQSQVLSNPTIQSQNQEQPLERDKVVFFVTLISMNDTFTKKHLLVPYHPDSRKLGRPAGSRVKPEVGNGYFDSRVLSRSHAAMFVEGHEGKLMIKDLNSSNGTYVNDERIGSEPMQLHLGDIVNLGFNIQADTNHKQISAKVENISVMRSLLLRDTSWRKESTDHDLETPQFKHYKYVQDIIKKINLSKPKEQKNNYTGGLDEVLFNDMALNIEDSWGLSSNMEGGLYNNSQLSATGEVVNFVRAANEMSMKVREQNNTLLSLEAFLNKYQRSLDKLNSRYLQQELEKREKNFEEQLYLEKEDIKKKKETYKSYKADDIRSREKLDARIKELEEEKEALQNQTSVDKLVQHNSSIANSKQLAVEEFFNNKKINLWDSLDLLNESRQENFSSRSASDPSIKKNFPNPSLDTIATEAEKSESNGYCSNNKISTDDIKNRKESDTPLSMQGTEKIMKDQSSCLQDSSYSSQETARNECPQHVGQRVVFGFAVVITGFLIQKLMK